MDATQWVEHAVSLIFGGAGGLAAGFAKLTSTLSAINKRQDAVERRIDLLASQKREQARQIDDVRAGLEKQMEELKKHTTAQLNLSHEMIGEKLDELRRDMGSMRSAAVEQQIELQRSLGEVEGTLKQIARNGCARTCNTQGRQSSHDLSEYADSEPPTRNPKRRQ